MPWPRVTVAFVEVQVEVAMTMRTSPTCRPKNGGVARMRSHARTIDDVVTSE